MEIRCRKFIQLKEKLDIITYWWEEIRKVQIIS